MADLRVHRLPVLNRDKRLVGILSLGDIALAEDQQVAGEALTGVSRHGGPHSQLAPASPARIDPLPQVGAPDPERKNSPIIDESIYEEDDAESRDLEIEQGACYFNGEEFPIGHFVQSGSELLQCTDRGVWIRKGEREGPASTVIAPSDIRPRG